MTDTTNYPWHCVTFACKNSHTWDYKHQDTPVDTDAEADRISEELRANLFCPECKEQAHSFDSNPIPEPA